MTVRTSPPPNTPAPCRAVGGPPGAARAGRAAHESTRRTGGCPKAPKTKPQRPLEAITGDPLTRPGSIACGDQAPCGVLSLAGDDPCRFRPPGGGAVVTQRRTAARGDRAARSRQRVQQVRGQRVRGRRAVVHRRRQPDVRRRVRNRRRLTRRAHREGRRPTEAEAIAAAGPAPPCGRRRGFAIPPMRCSRYSNRSWRRSPRCPGQ